MTEHTEHNIAARTAEERERINIDLAASSVAYKEHMNMPGLAFEIERQLPEHHQSYFLERLDY